MLHSSDGVLAPVLFAL